MGSLKRDRPIFRRLVGRDSSFVKAAGFMVSFALRRVEPCMRNWGGIGGMLRKTTSSNKLPCSCPQICLCKSKYRKRGTCMEREVSPEPGKDAVSVWFSFCMTRGPTKRQSHIGFLSCLPMHLLRLAVSVSPVYLKRLFLGPGAKYRWYCNEKLWAKEPVETGPFQVPWRSSRILSKTWLSLGNSFPIFAYGGLVVEIPCH